MPAVIFKGNELKTLKNLVEFNGNNVYVGASGASTATIQTGGVEAISVNSNQQTLLIDGTASNPSLSNIGDANTGIYFPAADKVSVSAGGTQVATATTTGLGVGTETPDAKITTQVPNATGVQLVGSIKNSAGNTRITELYDADNIRWSIGNRSSVGLLTVDEVTGNVGIGRTPTTNKLEVNAAMSVNGTTGTSFFLKGGTGINYFYYDDRLTFAKAGTGDVITIDASRNVGIVNSSPGHTLDTLGTGSYATDALYVLRVLNTTSTASSSKRIIDAQYSADTDCTGGYFFSCINSSGSIIGKATATSNTAILWDTSSDSRLKQNPTSFDGLAVIKSILPKQFEWISNPEKRVHGFYAQELYQVIPEAVSVGSDELTDDGNLKNPWGVDKSALVPFLVKAIQELAAKVEALEARVP